MKFFLRFFLMTVLILSPCSIKASLHQIIQKENIEINKTSPNKALSLDVSNCENFAQNSQHSPQQTKATTVDDFYEFNLIQQRKNFNATIKYSDANTDIAYRKLFILYSQLKIAGI